MLTLQEIYTKGCEHLNKQKVPAKENESWSKSCYYLDSATGNKCFIGGIMDEETLELVKNAVMGLASLSNIVKTKWVNEIFNFAGRDSEEQQLINQLQSIHDSKNPEDWPALYTTFAEKNNLIPFQWS